MLHFPIALALAAATPQQPSTAPGIAATIDHVALQVANVEVSAAFYRRVLGLRPYAQQVSPKMRWLGSESFQIHLLPGRIRPVDAESDTHFAFRVSNLADELRVLDEMHAAWANSDGTPRKITTRADGVLQAYFHDPDGYSIEVNQAPK